MVTFWVDEKLERGVEVTVGFADGTDIVRGIIERFGWHSGGRMGGCVSHYVM